jgi:co-chaperonin GroES (HSP10)
MTALFQPTKINSIRALGDHILVCDMNFDMRTSLGGIIILSGDKKLEGIHPRWARVYAVGPDQQDIRVGQYVCVKHGRWTRGLEIEDAEGEKTLRRVDNDDILLVSDEPMQDESIGDDMGVTQKSNN